MRWQGLLPRWRGYARCMAPNNELRTDGWFGHVGFVPKMPTPIQAAPRPVARPTPPPPPRPVVNPVASGPALVPMGSGAAPTAGSYVPDAIVAANAQPDVQAQLQQLQAQVDQLE